MAEKVFVRMDKDYRTDIWVADSQEGGSGEFVQAVHVHALNPYEMLLASLGACTASVLNTYAQYHSVDLEAVEILLQFDRVYEEDCKNCEELSEYEEQIKEEIMLVGDLDAHQREKLFAISHYCPIEKMLRDGMKIQSRLAETEEV